MRKCLFCKTHYKKGSTTSFHKFPTNLLEKGLWLQNMKACNWTPKEKDSLCSKHFDDECLIKHANRTSLKSGSVPTIFEDPSSFEEPEKSDGANECGGKDMDVEELAPSPDSNSCEKLEIAVCENVSVKNENDEEELLPKEQIYRHKNEIMSSCPTSEMSTLSKCQTPNSGVRRLQKDASTTTDELDRDQLLQDRSRLKNSVAHDHQYEKSPRCSKEALESTKRLLKLSRARVTALTHHVKRLKIKVANLKIVINDLKKRKKVSKDCTQLGTLGFQEVYI